MTFGILNFAANPPAVLTPVLSFVSFLANNNPVFSIDVASTITTGDSVRLQIQVTGGSWLSPVSDTTHVITSGESSVNEIDLSLSALSSNTYDARALVTHTIDSSWSPVITFTV